MKIDRKSWEAEWSPEVLEGSSGQRDCDGAVKYSGDSRLDVIRCGCISDPTSVCGS